MLAALLLAGGCAAPGLNQSVRLVQGREPSALFAAAEAALIELGYRIGERDAIHGLLVAMPIDDTVDVAPGERARRSLSPRPLRRVARLRIVPSGDACKLYCRVLIEQRVTESSRLLVHDLAGADTPGRTPIEREAATTPTQNEVWSAVRRDRLSEREILTRILGD